MPKERILHHVHLLRTLCPGFQIAANLAIFGFWHYTKAQSHSQIVPGMSSQFYNHYMRHNRRTIRICSSDQRPRVIGPSIRRECSLPIGTTPETNRQRFADREIAGVVDSKNLWGQGLGRFSEPQMFEKSRFSFRLAASCSPMRVGSQIAAMVDNRYGFWLWSLYVCKTFIYCIWLVVFKHLSLLLSIIFGMVGWLTQIFQRGWNGLKPPTSYI